MTNAKVPHGSFNAPGQYLNAMIQGSVHSGWSMLTNVRSLTRSLSQVIPSSVRMPATVFGMVRRLVTNFIRKSAQLVLHMAIVGVFPEFSSHLVEPESSE